MKKQTGWLIIGTLVLLGVQGHADTLVYDGTNFVYNLDDYATNSFYLDASLAYIDDKTKFDGEFRAWNKNDTSDSGYFNGGRSWEWNTDAEGPQEAAWTLTGLEAGARYNLSVVGLLNETIPVVTSRYSDTRYINVGIESGVTNMSHFFYTNLTDTVSSLPAGAVKAYDGSNEKYGSYIIPFADDIVADANGEFTVYFSADAGVRNTNNWRSYIDGVVVTPVSSAPYTIEITASGFNGEAFDVTATGLKLTRQYILKRTTDLSAGFTDVVGLPVTPSSDTETFTDSAPPAEAAFYQVMESE